jgi:enterochelin esterase-like enzyme
MAEEAHGEPAKGHVLVESFAYDGGRQVAVYVPPDPPETIVFAGDGQLVVQWGARLEAEDLRSTMIVGAYRSNDPDEMVRLREYSPSFDVNRFTAHEEFFVQQVRRWVESRFNLALPPERTGVCGVSASGELALALGMRHPDVYGTVLCASPGAGYRPPEPMPELLPRAYLVAGLQEPFFLQNAARWATALKDSGAEVVFTQREGNHGGPFWKEEFPRMVRWAFGSR